MHLCGALALGVLLGNVGDGKARGKGLLELLGLVGVLEDESVEVAVAADLELGLAVLLVLLDARSCWGKIHVSKPFIRKQYHSA